MATSRWHEERHVAAREQLGRPPLGWWLKHGVMGGLMMGLVFAASELVLAWVLRGPAALWGPLRMIGALVLGSTALEPAYPLLTAVLAGVGTHLGLSILFGALLGTVLFLLPEFALSAGILIVMAGLYGLLLWLMNFYVVAPAGGWNWFPDQSQPWVQFIAHVFFYGAGLGVYLAWATRGLRR